MKKKSIITLAGKPGSGKSTTARLLAEKLGYEHFSSGDLFREIARERGQTVKQANIDAESQVMNEKNIDELVDSRLREIGQTEDNKVIDSRTAWHWIPGAFKVFLDLDLEVAAQRILMAMKQTDLAEERNEHIPESVDEYAKELDERLASEARRYETLYGINPYKLENHDLVVDSGINDIDQVVEKILRAYKKWHS